MTTAPAAAVCRSPRAKASWWIFISGLQSLGTALVSGLRVVGSLNTWRVAISEKKKVRISEGVTMGILRRRAICHCEQPSSRAASYTSAGIARSAV